jgi:hypothetical protein
MSATNAYYPAGSNTGHWARHPDICEIPQLFIELRESTTVTEQKLSNVRSFMKFAHIVRYILLTLTIIINVLSSERICVFCTYLRRNTIIISK